MSDPKPCVIFDLDGTLADVHHRLHHVRAAPPDWPAFFAACVDDPPHGYVVELNWMVAQAARFRFDGAFVAPVVFICSGRPETYRVETEVWLREHGVFYQYLLMRGADDRRPDVVVKREMLSAIRAEGYEPIFSVDDRPSVVAMWRAEGVPCLAVDDVEWRGARHAAHGDVEGRTLLTVMVGTTCAGKSTWLLCDSDVDPGPDSLDILYEHVLSSDQVRADLLGDRRDQTQNGRVFAAFHAVAAARLRHGLPTVLDATHLRRRDRRAAAELAPVGTRVRYAVLDRPLEAKLASAAGKGVPEDVVRRQDQVFRSNLRDILAGDGLESVDVLDLREARP